MSQVLTALRHAGKRRCPRCGTKLFDGWFRIRPICSGCGLLTDRGERDYFLGAMLLNVIAGELGAAIGAAGVVGLTLPRPAWGLALATGLSLAIVGPLVGYPFAKTIWLAVDMQLRPPVTEGEPSTDA